MPNDITDADYIDLLRSTMNEVFDRSRLPIPPLGDQKAAVLSRQFVAYANGDAAGYVQQVFEYMQGKR